MKRALLLLALVGCSERRPQPTSCFQIVVHVDSKLVYGVTCDGRLTFKD